MNASNGKQRAFYFINENINVYMSERVPRFFSPFLPNRTDSLLWHSFNSFTGSRF